MALGKGDELISLLAAAKQRPVSHETLRRAAVRKDLRADKVGNIWVTTMRDVDKYLADHPPIVGRPKQKT